MLTALSATSRLFLSTFSIVQTRFFVLRAVSSSCARFVPACKAVLDAFRLYRKSSVLISQQIGTEDPFTWLMARRESANYKNPKFCEPSAPPHFKLIEK